MKQLRKTGLLLLCAALALTAAGSPARADGSGAERPTPRTGGTVTFGHYEQDNDPGNGPEPIEWTVVEVDRAGGRALLVSRYGLDAQPFEQTDLLPPEAFEEAEQARIAAETEAILGWFAGDFDPVRCAESAADMRRGAAEDARIDAVFAVLDDVYQPKKRGLPKPAQCTYFEAFYDGYREERGEAAGSWYEFVSVVGSMLEEDRAAGASVTAEARVWYADAAGREDFDARYDRLRALVPAAELSGEIADPDSFMGRLLALCGRIAAGEDADVTDFLRDTYAAMKAELIGDPDADAARNWLQGLVSPEKPEDARLEAERWLSFLRAAKERAELLPGADGAQERTVPDAKMQEIPASALLRPAVAASYALQSYQANYGDRGLRPEAIWQNSSLRAWLNGAFLNAAFTDAERAQMRPDGQDPLRIPDLRQIRNILRSDRMVELMNPDVCYATDYCMAVRASGTREAKRPCLYWVLPIRTQGGAVNAVRYQSEEAWAAPDSTDIAVRPVLWVSLDADIF